MGRVRRAWWGPLLGIAAVAGAACQPIPTASVAPVPTPPAAARTLTFPVDGTVRYGDDFGDCRGSGCSRRHQGIDLLGTKLQPLLAAATGTITWARFDARVGNTFVITDAEGWEYWYVHVNNDTPGTDDGANPPEWIMTGGLKVGSPVTAGQHVSYLGDSGNAESSSPHLHFEVHRPDDRPVNPYPSLRAAQGTAPSIPMTTSTTTVPAAAPAGAPAAATAATTTVPPAERALRRGDRGPDVAAWQTALNERRGAGLTADGVFGAATDTATRTLQRDSGLPVDGVVGRATRAALAALPPRTA